VNTPSAHPARPVTPRHVARLYGPEFAADPHAVYRTLRAYGPAARVEIAPGVPATLVTSYRTALKILRDPQRFPKDPSPWEATLPPDCPVKGMLGARPNALFSDGPAHARLRAAIADSLNRIDRLTLVGHVKRSADTLIDQFGPTGQADLVAQYAALLPLRVLITSVFGCPAALAQRFLSAMAAIFESGADAERGNEELFRCAGELVVLKRRNPGPDVTSWLIQHPARLTDAELAHQLILLVGAGSEPETNLIAHGLRLMLVDDRFGGDLAGGNLTIDDALDEVLWKEPSMANYGATHPVTDVEVDGVRFVRGQPVLISFAACNTSPELERYPKKGNRAHLAWSAGPHACPAQSHARLIAAISIERILDRIPDMTLAIPDNELSWREGPFHRALASLPVLFPPIPAPVHATTPGETSHAPVH
jgi:cytochrome P450